jgi:excinuclease UvrABC nuclease subunit
LEEYDQSQNAENCSELAYLAKWRDEVAANETGESTREAYSPLARLQHELEEAVNEERFEDAARLRDTIRAHSQGPSPGGPRTTL